MSSVDIADWVFESVLQFLKSPMWTSPVEEFLEEHCTAFDPMDPENKLEYTTLHNMFRSLVDDLLSSFLGELGVDIGAFVDAIKDIEDQEEGGEGAKFSAEHKEISHMLSEYLIAIDDFTTFRSMMEHRTTELEVEAMEEHHKYASAGGEEEEDDDMDEDERFLVEMAIHASLGTEEMMMKQLAAEDAKLLKELAFQIAVEHEKALKEMLEAEAADQALSEVGQAAMEAKKKEIEEGEQRKIAALQAEIEKQRVAQVEETLAKLQNTESHPKTTTDRKPLGDLMHGATGRNACTVFGAQKTALPGLAPSSCTTHNNSKPQPLSQIIAHKENTFTSDSKRQPSVEPTAQEIQEREQYFKALGEKLRSKNQTQRKVDVAEFARKNEIENSAPANTSKCGAEMSAEQREMRIQLARRFKEDLIQESRKPLK